MVLCPVAIAVGCNKCPIVKICPAKGIIGDFKKPEEGRPVSGPASKRSKKKK